MKEIPLHFFRIQKTDRYVRFKFGQVNIYFSWKPLRTRPQNRDIETAKNKRKALKRKLLNRGGTARYAVSLLYGKPQAYTISCHIRKTPLKNLTSTISNSCAATATCECIR